jgi:hypothetical protein
MGRGEMAVQVSVVVTSSDDDQSTCTLAAIEAAATDELRKRRLYSEAVGMNLDSNTTPWIVTIGATAIAALSSALAFMFKLSESKSAKSIAALESRQLMYENRGELLDKLNRECVADRARLEARCEIFEKRLSQIEEKACGIVGCELRAPVIKVTKQE